MLNVQIISKRMIKPSSPTPSHLMKHQLSSLDQIAPPVHVAMIFYYDAKDITERKFNRAYISHQLKASLSETLTMFYPLAGRIKGNQYVNCNDDGAEFIEAEVHTNLSHIIENPEIEEKKQFLPMNPCGEKFIDLILAIQINYFDCGGIAIGICASHKIVDGFSYVTFINSWAAKSSGAGNITRPNVLDLAKHFPPTEASCKFEMSLTWEKKKIATKRFVFDEKMLKTLKSAAASGLDLKDPSRVEALSAFIWKIIVKRSKEMNKKLSGIGHAVNLKPIMGADNFFGNLWRVAETIVEIEKDSDDQDLLSPMRRSIKEVDKKFVKKIANGEGYMDFIKSRFEIMDNRDGDLEFFKFSSWCRFPVYEADFGWGSPVWVCPTTLPFKNLAILMSTKCGEGIEAWINLCPKDMVVLEQAYNLLLSITH